MCCVLCVFVCVGVGVCSSVNYDITVLCVVRPVDMGIIL